MQLSLRHFHLSQRLQIVGALRGESNRGSVEGAQGFQGASKGAAWGWGIRLGDFTSERDVHHVATHFLCVILSEGGLAAGVEGPLSWQEGMDTQRERRYYVYILASYSGTLYIGVTGKLRRRIWQHEQHAIEGFTAHYAVTRLLYFEVYNEVLNAIAREKQLKGWRRAKKVALIAKRNPKWEDLSREWYSEDDRELLAKFREPGDRRE